MNNRTRKTLLLAALMACLSQEQVDGAQLNIRDSRDLKAAFVLEEREQSGCIRVANATQEVGCSSAKGGIEAPLLLYSASTIRPISDNRVLLVNASQLPELLIAMRNSPLSQIKGILVDPRDSGSANLDASFPQAAFAPYKEQQSWNRDGTGGLWNSYSLPIQMLSHEIAAVAVQQAEVNAKQGFAGALHNALLDTTMAARHNSSSCLAAGTCEPLGAHSVWAAWPPVAANLQSEMPVIMLLAQMDGIGFFHDDIVGADAPISGLVAMLAAASLLGNSSSSQAYQRRIVFAALAGEGWGYMGSKRLLWEMADGSDSMQGLSLEKIQQVMELGQVGRMSQSAAGKQQLFFHSQAGTNFGDSAPLWEAVQASAQSMDQIVRMQRASSSNPGIPPSSLMSFLRANRSIAGAVLVEFNSEYTNSVYGTQFDTLDGINVQGIAAAASLTAQTLHRLADGPGTLEVDNAALTATVDMLLKCLASESPLQDCPMADNLITKAGMGSNYVGVLHTLTSDSQDPDTSVKNDLSRFIWNYLALHLSAGRAQLASGEAGGCDPKEHVCEPGAVCQGFRIDKDRADDNGCCLFATARYVPAYSTRVECTEECKSGVWGSWSMSNASRAWEQALAWPPDPVWTESRWELGIPKMQLFQVESARTDSRILLAGIAVTLFTVVVVYLAKFAYAHRLKQQ